MGPRIQCFVSSLMNWSYREKTKGFHHIFQYKNPSPINIASPLPLPYPALHSFSSFMAMKLLKLLFILFITTSTVSAASSGNENNEDNSIVGAAWSADENKEDSAVESHLALPGSPESYIALPEGEETTSSDGTSDFMFQNKHLTCDEFPPLCRRKSSPGPDCCKKKCVNIGKDPNNCGQCGRKCKHGDICCRGHCVNPSVDPLNCGRCGNKCKKWETCLYGMCSYAWFYRY